MCIRDRGDVDLARSGVHRRPLGAIHGRGASTVGGGAGVEQHLGLAGEAVLGAQAVLSVYQGQPLAAAVGIETRGVQRACVQQIAVGARIGLSLIHI